MSDEQTPDLNELAAAVARVMAGAPIVHKNERNTFQGYDYTSEAAISNAVRPLMAAHGLALLPVSQDVSLEVRATKGGGQGIMATGVWRYLLVHTSGQSRLVTAQGHGWDTSDKAAAKAATMALKYLLIQLFLLGRGDDPDAGSAADEQPALASPPTAPPTAAPLVPPAGAITPEVVWSVGPDGKKRGKLTNWRDLADEQRGLAVVPFGKRCGQPLSALSDNELDSTAEFARGKVGGYFPLLDLACQIERERRATDAPPDGEIPF